MQTTVMGSKTNLTLWKLLGVETANMHISNIIAKTLCKKYMLAKKDPQEEPTKRLAANFTVHTAKKEIKERF